MERSRRHDSTYDAERRRRRDETPSDAASLPEGESRGQQSWADPSNYNGPSNLGPYGAPMGAPYQTSVGSSGYGTGYGHRAPPPMDPWQAMVQTSTENMALTRELGDLRMQLRDAQQECARTRDDYQKEFDSNEQLWDELQDVKRERDQLAEQLDAAQAETRLATGNHPGCQVSASGTAAGLDRGTVAHRRFDAVGLAVGNDARTGSLGGTTTTYATTEEERRSAPDRRGRRREVVAHLHPDALPHVGAPPDRWLRGSPGSRLPSGSRDPHHRVHRRTPPREPTVALASRIAGPPTAHPPGAGVQYYPGDAVDPAAAEDDEVDAIRDRQHQPDAALEASTQPRSAWYVRWSSPIPLAQAYAELDQDSEDDDDDPMSAAHIVPYDPNLVNEDRSPFPDPIMSRARDMTRQAERLEDARVQRARSAGKQKLRAQQGPPVEFRAQGPEFGAWDGQTIESVVQAHNLRWLAIVDREPTALAYYRALTRHYQDPTIRRPAGVRYLMASSSGDLKSVKDVLRGEGLVYPAAGAPMETVREYYRNIPTSKWPKAVRTLDGREPVRGLNVFEEPYLLDAYGALVLKHTLPSHSRQPKIREHASRIKDVMVQLFSIPGLYLWIVKQGSYDPGMPTNASPYPYDTKNITMVLLAAWLADHGLGVETGPVGYLERWARAARNAKLNRDPNDNSPWPDFPTSLSDLQSADSPLIIRPRNQLAWGQLFDNREDSAPGDRAYSPAIDSGTDDDMLLIDEPSIAPLTRS
ncbi:hypothetical protein FKP32DRAFT_1678640 [Trametes sanguinea]|nr:hypothetical protein FKP32DRAFT_1678640 [Trametes sanguinea]